MTKDKIGKIVNFRQISEKKDGSYVNTQLRDFYKSLDDFCEDRGLVRKELEDKLDMIDYAYDPAVNQFV